MLQNSYIQLDERDVTADTQTALAVALERYCTRKRRCLGAWLLLTQKFLNFIRSFT
jgi:hypothetical protein